MLPPYLVAKHAIMGLTYIYSLKKNKQHQFDFSKSDVLNALIMGWGNLITLSKIGTISLLRDQSVHLDKVIKPLVPYHFFLTRIGSSVFAISRCSFHVAQCCSFIS